MHQQYYDTHTSTVRTWQQQAAPSARFPYGLGLDSDGYVVNLGVYPYREHYEEFDKLTQKLVPDEVPSIENGEAVLYYRAIPLAPDVIAASTKADAETQVTARSEEA